MHYICNFNGLGPCNFPMEMVVYTSGMDYQEMMELWFLFWTKEVINVSHLCSTLWLTYCGQVYKLNLFNKCSCVCQVSKTLNIQLDWYGADGRTFPVTAESGNCNILSVLDQPLQGYGQPSLLTIGNKLAKLERKLNCCLTIEEKSQKNKTQDTNL